MKLTGARAARFFNAPDPEAGGILLYGADAMRVALKRQSLIVTLIGEKGADEMRLERISAPSLQKDPAMLGDTLKAQGFFPGKRVVLVEEATDRQAKLISNAFQDWKEGDAILVVTSGVLKPRSTLRKFFEYTKNAVSIGIYDDPPSRADLERELKMAGVRDVAPDAMSDLVRLSAALDPGDLHQFIEKLALYTLSDTGAPISLEDIEACLPNTMDAAVDDLIHAVAEAECKKIIPLMQRLSGQGFTAVSLCIMAGRHFRMLHQLASDQGGVQGGFNAPRLPVFGPARARITCQAQSWNSFAIEAALNSITTTDLALRSAGQNAPAMALVERTFIRLALMPHIQ